MNINSRLAIQCGSGLGEWGGARSEIVEEISFKHMLAGKSKPENRKIQQSCQIESMLPSKTEAGETSMGTLQVVCVVLREQLTSPNSS